MKNRIRAVLCMICMVIGMNILDMVHLYLSHQILHYKAGSLWNRYCPETIGDIPIDWLVLFSQQIHIAHGIRIRFLYTDLPYGQTLDHLADHHHGFHCGLSE